jgi:hypothetical protein
MAPRSCGRHFDDCGIADERLLFVVNMPQREFSIGRLAGDYFTSMYTSGKAITA